MGKRANLLILFALIVVVAGWLVWRKKSTAGPQGLPSIRSSSEYERLSVVAHLDVPVSNERSIVYCGSLQLAWNKLNRLVGAPVSLDGDLDDMLNRATFSKDDLDSASVVTAAGDDEATIARIDKEMKELGVERQGPGSSVPNQFSVMAILRKSLKFRYEFDVLSQRLTFDSGDRTSQVAAFGIKDKLTTSVRSDFDRQVTVRDYRSANDFVVQLHGESAEDELILAKVPVGKAPVGNNLEAMVHDVLRRSYSGGRGTPGRMAIPLLQLNVAHRFQELMNKPFKNPNRNGWMILDAVQATRFELNSKGGELVSGSAISGMKDGDGPPRGPPPRPDLYFDRPFLLIMKQRLRPRPYFVMWIASADLMVQ